MTGHQLWLRLGVCLAASAGLHAGLSAVDWRAPAAIPAATHSVAIALIESPTVLVTAGRERAKPAPPAAPRPTSRQLPSPVRSLPVQLPPVAETVSSPAPDATVVEGPGDSSAVPAELAPTDAANGGGGDRTTSGAAKPETGDGGGGEGGGGPLKAIPRYESNPLPHYPRLARQNRWEGTVRLRALVTAGGDVEGLTLERSSGHAVLDHSALDGVRRWRFIPATRAGVSVPCEVSIPVAFRLQE